MTNTIKSYLQFFRHQAMQKLVDLPLSLEILLKNPSLCKLFLIKDLYLLTLQIKRFIVVFREDLSPVFSKIVVSFIFEVRDFCLDSADSFQYYILIFVLDQSENSSKTILEDCLQNFLSFEFVENFLVAFRGELFQLEKDYYCLIIGFFTST